MSDRHESFSNERQHEYIEVEPDVPDNHSDNELRQWVQGVFTFAQQKDTAADVKAQERRRVHLGVRIIVLLVTMGIVSGLVNGSITLALESTSRAIAQLFYLSFPGYVFGYLALILFATSLGKLAVQACGSGLPELKHILAGEMRPADYEQFTSLRVLLVKGFGLIAAGSIAPLGREGPLVHTSACVTNLLLSKISMFRDIVDSPELCRQCFAASAAVGVASSFNAPVGGLLFSVEVTSTYYLISNYWKSFVAAVAGSIVCNLILMTYYLGGNSSTGIVCVLPIESHLSSSFRNPRCSRSLPLLS